MLVLPADHVVTGEKAFQAAVTLGMQLAGKGRRRRSGSSRPGRDRVWIHSAESANHVNKKGRLAGYPVARFVEKPRSDKAVQYLKGGNYFWNSGMFLWKAATIRDEINRHQPQLAKAVQESSHPDDIGRRSPADWKPPTRKFLRSRSTTA